MFYRAGRAVLIAAAALSAISCSRAPKPGIERIAILRFENLTPNAAPDWIGRAFVEVITSEISGAPGVYAIPSSRLHQLEQGLGARPASAPGISAERALAVAAGANRIGYGDYGVVDGRLRVRLTIEDVSTGKAARAPIEAATGSGDVLGAAAAIAKQISPEARPYGTKSETALAAFARVLESGEAGAVASGAEQSIAADPNFGAAYNALVEMRLKQQDRAGAEAALRTALAHAGGMQPVEQARLMLLDSTLRNDAAQRERALGLFVKAAPLDPAGWRAVGDFEAGRHRFGQALAAYERAAAIEPEDASLANEMAYGGVYAGNFGAARAAASRYAKLRPADPNPLDTTGDIELMMGRPAEAERAYLAALQKNPQFLGGADAYKAAVARLTTGDVAGADGLLKEKAPALAGSASWLWLTGRRKEAVAKRAAEVATLPGRDAQSRACAELTVWTMLLGDREAAARAAQQATALATPATAAPAAVARFIALPAAGPEEWASRANQMFPNAPAGSIRDLALGAALLLNGHFAAAVPVLTQLEARTVANGDRGFALELAWALVETGRFQDAAPLARWNAAPDIGSTSLFVPLYFPRMFQVRTAIAEHEGKTAEAQENRRIYAALGGK